MRYWWVNQNQTYRHEVLGHYLWSPKRKKNGHANAYYDFMREVAPGDVVLSFADTRIKAIGIARSNAYEAPKPLEFGQTGAYWEQIGWRVDVGFIELRRPIRPSEYMDVLAPLLPSKYAPLRSIGTGLQSVYLTRLPEALAAALIDLIGVEARDIIRGKLLLEGVTSPAMDWIPAYAGMTGAGGSQRHAHPRDRARGHCPCAARAGDVQGERDEDRARVPYHGRHARRASARKPLQAVAGLEQRGAPRWGIGSPSIAAIAASGMTVARLHRLRGRRGCTGVTRGPCRVAHQAGG